MGFGEMGKWARGMVAGASMAAGIEGGVNKAEAAAPEPQEQSAEQKNSARDKELTSWVADLGVQGLEIKKSPVKGAFETIDVFVDGQKVGSVMCDGWPQKNYWKDALHADVERILRQTGVTK